MNKLCNDSKFYLILFIPVLKEEIVGARFNSMESRFQATAPLKTSEFEPNLDLVSGRDFPPLRSYVQSLYTINYRINSRVTVPLFLFFFFFPKAV